MEGGVLLYLNMILNKIIISIIYFPQNILSNLIKCFVNILSFTCRTFISRVKNKKCQDKDDAGTTS